MPVFQKCHFETSENKIYFQNLSHKLSFQVFLPVSLAGEELHWTLSFLCSKLQRKADITIGAFDASQHTLTLFRCKIRVTVGTLDVAIRNWRQTSRPSCILGIFFRLLEECFLQNIFFRWRLHMFRRQY